MTNLQQLHEEWKDISGYEGLYQASNLGRIKRMQGRSCKQDRLVGQYLNSRGYYKVILSKDDKTKNHLAHRLIAEAFIPNDNEDYNVVNHINMDQIDNRVANLEWCTQKMNIQSCWAIRGKPIRRKNVDK